MAVTASERNLRSLPTRWQTTRNSGRTSRIKMVLVDGWWCALAAVKERLRLEISDEESARLSLEDDEPSRLKCAVCGNYRTISCSCEYPLFQPLQESPRE